MTRRQLFLTLLAAIGFKFAPKPAGIIRYHTGLSQFQFGFTGFKDAATTIDTIPRYLFAGNLVVPNARTQLKLAGTLINNN